MLIRPEALMGVFRNLPESMRGPALEALGASIFEQGSDSARAYRRHGGEGPALAQVVAATAPQLGWGIWRFELDLAARPDAMALEVRNSPFAAGFGPSPIPVCHAIVGMARAVATLIFDRPASVIETQCAATGAPFCRFEARPL
nr:V4R domain-containing protein [Alsobacter ponti]